MWIVQISQTVLVAEAYAKNALVRNAAYVGIVFAKIAKMKYGLVVIVVRRLFVVTVQRDRIGLNVMNAGMTSVTIAMKKGTDAIRFCDDCDTSYCRRCRVHVMCQEDEGKKNCTECIQLTGPLLLEEVKKVRKENKEVRAENKRLKDTNNICMIILTTWRSNCSVR